MRGAIVHEWLEVLGGAENVVDRFAQLYPEAPIYTLWNDSGSRFPVSRVHGSWLANTKLRRHKSLALPLMPLVWRHLGAEDLDWVLCSSHLFAHHARFSGAARDATKFVYAYTPARYIWDPHSDPRGRALSARVASPFLRPLDKKRAADAHSIVAISRFVAERIEKTWERATPVIYPPVNLARFERLPALNEADELELAKVPESFILGASRFVRYKRLEDVIHAGSVVDSPVVIAGSGPDEDRLRAEASRSRVPVHFVLSPSHELLVHLYDRAAAFVFPAIEDFGIMPVEAMASGTPVIGLRRGGVAETVSDGISGVLIDNFGSTSELRAAFETVTALDESGVKARARVFDESTFDRAIRDWLPHG